LLEIFNQNDVYKEKALVKPRFADALHSIILALRNDLVVEELSDEDKADNTYKG